MKTNWLTTFVAIALAATKSSAATVPTATDTVEAQADGDVFGLITIHSGNTLVHLRTVNVYSDGGLGINDSAGARPFKGVIFNEHGVIFQPEPIRILDVEQDHSLKIADTLYHPTTGWTADGHLALEGKREGIICPTFDNRLYWANDDFTCPGGVGVDLLVVTTPRSSGDWVFAS